MEGRWRQFFGHARVSAAALTLGLVAVQWSPLGAALSVRVEQRALFTVRELLKPSTLDPRLKIFVFDDQTAAALASHDLSLDDWATVLTALGQRRPQRILVDKLFDKPYAAAEVQAFAQRATAFAAPVGVIGFVAKTIPGRREIALDRREFRLAVGTNQAGSSEAAGEVRTSPYGAAPELAQAFSYIGHALYNGDGSVAAMVPLGQGRYLPHLALLGEGELTLEHDQLRLDGQLIARDDRGHIPVNFAPKETYLQRAYSLSSLVAAARAGQPVSVVNAGDRVVILPAMYTGNTDWRESPFGSMAGGYVLTALVNSVLAKQWLTPLAEYGLLTAASGFIAVLSAEVLSLAGIWLFVLAAIVLWPLLAFVGFVAGGIIMPWVLPTMVTPLAAAMVLRARVHAAEREQQRLQAEMQTATLVQSAFFPERQGQAQIVVAGAMRSASACGGDWWGRLAPAPGVDGLVIADATGHGVSAALVTAMAFATTHALEKASSLGGALLTPRLLLTLLNQTLCALANKDGTMTCLVCFIDLARFKLICANGGHNLPLLIPRDPNDARVAQRKIPILTLLLQPSTLLGTEADAVFTEAKFDFKPGDRLVLFTDGIIENRGGPDGAPWGKAAFCRTLLACRTLPAAAARDQVLAAAALYADRTPAADDASLVIVDLMV